MKFFLAIWYSKTCSSSNPVSGNCILKTNHLTQLKVKYWFQLGLELEIEDWTLEKIELDYKEFQRCLMEVIMEWLRSVPDPTYRKLVNALFAVGEEVSAMEICHKGRKFNY